MRGGMPLESQMDSRHWLTHPVARATANRTVNLGKRTRAWHSVGRRPRAVEATDPFEPAAGLPAGERARRRRGCVHRGRYTERSEADA